MTKRADRVLDQIATALDSTKGKLSSKKLLREINSCWPKLKNQLEAVKKQSIIFKQWGRSLNFDENAKKEIVNKTVIDCLSDFLDCPRFKKNTYNAGILHCYGYLFSLIQTPYGLKRKRWTGNTLSKGFGFSNKELQIQCRSGSLIGNITYFLSMVTASEKKKKEVCSNPWTKLVSPSVKDYSYESLEIQTKTVRTEVGSQKKREKLLVVYDVVRLPKPVKSGESHLLIYRIGPSKKSLSFITAFPIQKDFANQIAKLPVETKRKEHFLRFNATV